VRSKADGMAIA